jgi:hypothetical protein
MSWFHTPGRPTIWIGLAAVLLLMAGIAVGLRQARPPRPRPVPVESIEPTDEGVVEQALRQIPVPADSSAIKTGWRDEVAGVDVSSLDSTQLEIFLRFANSEPCTCGCGYTLAACRAFDLECPVSLPRAEALLDSVRTGRIRSAEGLRERPSGG